MNTIENRFRFEGRIDRMKRLARVRQINAIVHSEATIPKITMRVSPWYRDIGDLDGVMTRKVWAGE